MYTIPRPLYVPIISTLNFYRHIRCCEQNLSFLIIPSWHELLVPSIQLNGVAQLLSHQNSSLIKIQNVTSIVTSLDVVVIVRSLSLNEDS